MAKSKERLDAEANHQMTGKQKLSNFWFYYKWWLVAAVVSIAMLAVFIRDIRSNVKPDYTIGVLTQHSVQEATLNELEAAMLPLVYDRNGDGKTVVQLSSYTVVVGEQPADPMTHAAAMTRLSGDIQMGESMLFITDDLEAYQQNMELFSYNDGTAPPEGGTVDYTRMGVALTNCPPLAQVAIDGSGKGEFVLVKRVISPEQLGRSKEAGEYHEASMRLFDELTAK